MIRNTKRRRHPGALALAAIAGFVLPLVLAVASQWLPAYEEPIDVEAGTHSVEVVDTRPIAPGPGLPEGLVLGAANNNLDAVRTADGWVFLAVRTAPNHFASPQARIVVLRSRDEVQWQLDAEFSLGRDLREPRLLAHAGRVVLFVSRLGKNPFAFEPEGMSRAVRSPDGAWSTLEPFGPAGAIGWRARHIGGTPTLLLYRGGGTAYGAAMPDMRIDLWRSADALEWAPWRPGDASIYVGGGGEADFARAADGSFLGVIRVESGDQHGWGSRVCRVAAGDPTAWRCRSDLRKFDSPFAFSHDGEVYLLGRRHLRGDGRFDRGVGPREGAGRILRTVWNHLGYSFARKRCALWRIASEPDKGDGVGARVEFVLDLPSRGDTCFAAALPAPASDEWVIYDYSSPLGGPDVRWLEGQLAPTGIYRHVLRFTRLAK